MIADVWHLSAMLRHRRLSGDAIADLQLRRLRSLVHHAYANVPYYQTLFRKVGIEPEDIRCLDDLRHIPVSSKADLRAAGTDWFAANLNRSDCIDVLTSGTTGEPTHVYLHRSEGRSRRLDGFRTFRALGYGPLDRLARIGNDSHSHPVYLRHRLGIFRTTTVSGLLDAETQIRMLRDIDPTILVGFPSCFRAVLQKLDGKLSRVAHPRFLISGAEPQDHWVEEQIRADLGVPIYNFYGSVETGPIASECKTREGLHVHADRILVESDEGPETSDGFRPAVITVLDSYATPMLRYRLGDLVRHTGRACSCGSGFPLIDAPAGREWSVLQLPDGSQASPFRLSYVLERLAGLRQFRVTQTARDRLTIEAAADESQLPPHAITASVHQALGSDLQVEVQYVPTIGSPGRKVQAFVSLLAKPQG